MASSEFCACAVDGDGVVGDRGGVDVAQVAHALAEGGFVAVFVVVVVGGKGLLGKFVGGGCFCDGGVACVWVWPSSGVGFGDGEFW